MGSAIVRLCARGVQPGESAQSNATRESLSLQITVGGLGRACTGHQQSEAKQAVDSILELVQLYVDRDRATDWPIQKNVDATERDVLACQLAACHLH